MLASVAAAIVYANLMEWLIHKHILHGKRFGKKKGTFWSFHWGDHHRTCRKNGNYDASYERLSFNLNSQTKELLGLLIGGVLHLPLVFLWPVFYITLMAYIGAYWYLHRKCHLDVEWGKKWMPGHYWHHMGRNQNTNWNIFLPLWDAIFRTRSHK